MGLTIPVGYNGSMSSEKGRSVTCCFCGESVRESEALHLTVTKTGSPSRQIMWAHVAHLEAAVAPSRIELLPIEWRVPDNA